MNEKETKFKQKKWKKRQTTNYTERAQHKLQNQGVNVVWESNFSQKCFDVMVYHPEMLQRTTTESA